MEPRGRIHPRRRLPARFVADRRRGWRRLCPSAEHRLPGRARGRLRCFSPGLAVRSSAIVSLLFRAGVINSDSHAFPARHPIRRSAVAVPGKRVAVTIFSYTIFSSLFSRRGGGGERRGARGLPPQQGGDPVRGRPARRAAGSFARRRESRPARPRCEAVAEDRPASRRPAPASARARSARRRPGRDARGRSTRASPRPARQGRRGPG